MDNNAATKIFFEMTIMTLLYSCDFLPFPLCRTLYYFRNRPFFSTPNVFFEQFTILEHHILALLQSRFILSWWLSVDTVIFTFDFKFLHLAYLSTLPSNFSTWCAKTFRSNYIDLIALIKPYMFAWYKEFCVTFKEDFQS